MVIKGAYDVGADIFDRLKIAEKEKDLASSKTMYQELCLEFIEDNRILRLENFELKSNELPPLSLDEWAMIDITDPALIRLIEIFQIDVRGMLKKELSELLQKIIRNSLKSGAKQGLK